MNPDSSSSTTNPRYGAASFAAAILSIFAMEFATWVAAVPYVLPAVIYVLPGVLMIDLIVYVLFARRAGRLGRVGRGILIGSLAVPASLIVFPVGFIIAHAIGPI